MPLTAQQIEAAAAKLADGPVVIGETHSSATARDGVIALIEKGVVRALSLEGPMVPTACVSQQGGHVASPSHLDTYYNNANIEPFEGVLTYKNMAQSAMAHAPPIPVYFHDLPCKQNSLRSTVDPTYHETALAVARLNEPTRQDLPVKASFLVRILGTRNDFTCGYLKQKFGEDAAAWVGLVVVVGSDHLRALPSQERPLQLLLKIPEGRIFFWEP